MLHRRAVVARLNPDRISEGVGIGDTGDIAVKGGEYVAFPLGMVHPRMLSSALLAWNGLVWSRCDG